MGNSLTLSEVREQGLDYLEHKEYYPGHRKKYVFSYKKNNTWHLSQYGKIIAEGEWVHWYEKDVFLYMKKGVTYKSTHGKITKF